MSTVKQDTEAMLRQARLRNIETFQKHADEVREQLGLPKAIVPVVHNTNECIRFFKRTHNCPYCESSSIGRTDFSGPPEETDCKAECNTCGATWVEMYALKTAFQFKPGESNG